MALTNKGLIKITPSGSAGYVEFAPQALKVGHESLSDSNSGRTADGTMSISWTVGTGDGQFYAVPYLEVTLPPHKVDDVTYSKILSYVQGHNYTVEYYDPLKGNWDTCSFYTSSSSADWYSGVTLNGIVQGETFKATGITNKAYDRFNPGPLSAPVISRESNRISWRAVSHATGYIVSDNNVQTTTTSKYYDVTNLSTSHTIFVKATSTNPQYTTSANSNIITYTPVQSYTLTLTRNLNESCTVYGDGTYDSGTAVLIRCIPNTNYRFDGWYDGNTCISTSASYTYTITSNKTLQARCHYRAANEVELKMSVDKGNIPNISYKINGVTYSSGTTVILHVGDTVTLKGLGSSQYNQFAYWQYGNTKWHNPDVTFTIYEDRNITAVFDYRVNLCNLTVEVAEHGGFTVDGVGPTIDYLDAYGREGDSMQITAVPESGYRFVYWTRDGETESTSVTYSVEFEQDIMSEYEGIFEVGQSYTLTINNSYDIPVTVNSESITSYPFTMQVSSGETVHLQTSYDATSGNNRFVCWKNSNGSVMHYNRYDVVMNSNQTITLDAYISWNVNGKVYPEVPAGSHGKIQIDGQLPYLLPGELYAKIRVRDWRQSGVPEPEDKVTLKAIPDAGYTFTGWYDSGVLTTTTAEIEQTFIPDEAYNAEDWEARFN